MFKIDIQFSLIIFLIYFFVSCSSDTITEQIPEVEFENIQITKYGSEQTLDIATWNIEHFPKDAKRTSHYLSRAIHDMDLDLIAVQEIDNNSSFYSLMDSLQGYEGYVTTLPDYGQRLGLIYKSNIISIDTLYQIFKQDDWAFPRPPLVGYIQVKKNSQTIFDFTIIVNHLKAFGDNESEGRRREACSKLKDYINTTILTGPDQDVIILGDFNDEVDDELTDNVFQVFIDDSLNYQILTLPVATIPTYISGYSSTIDHIMITDDTREEYQDGITRVLKLDEEFSNYIKYISDHRPVLAQFFVF